MGRIWWDVFGADFSWCFFVVENGGGGKGVIYGLREALEERICGGCSGLDDGVLCGSSERQAVMLLASFFSWNAVENSFGPRQPTRPRNVPVSDLWAFTKPLMWRVRYLEDGLPVDVSN